MRKFVLHILVPAAILICLSACKKEAEVIPRAKLSKIYAELFVADSWLFIAPSEAKYKADTMAFYEPIFKKYGYSTADYLWSVEYYLNDPERFARIINKARSIMESELETLNPNISSPVPSQVDAGEEVIDGKASETPDSTRRARRHRERRTMEKMEELPR